MAGTWIVFRKEFADHLSSRRFYILLFIINLIGLLIAYDSSSNLREDLERTGGEYVFIRLFTTQAGVIPPLLMIIAVFGPLIAFILTFDSINREATTGTLGIVLSQPIHRDSVINGKFTAGAAAMSLIVTGILLLTTGIQMVSLSALPTLEEVLRICGFLFVSVVYLSMWVALGLLFSILFKREGTSALASIATWIFFIIFVNVGGITGGDVGALPLSLKRLFPPFIYIEASSTVLIPSLSALGRMLSGILGSEAFVGIYGRLPNPLPIGQSILLVWPHLTALIAIMLGIFTISYVRFMRQEIRPV